MIESRGKKQGFATRSGAKNETAAQKDDWEDEIFRKQAVWVRNARGKKTVY